MKEYLTEQNDFIRIRIDDYDDEPYSSYKMMGRDFYVPYDFGIQLRVGDLLIFPSKGDGESKPKWFIEKEQLPAAILESFDFAAYEIFEGSVCRISDRYINNEIFLFAIVVG